MIKWSELDKQRKQECRELVSKYTNSQSHIAQAGIGMRYGRLEPDEVTKEAVRDLLSHALNYYNAYSTSLSKITFEED